MKIEGMLLSLIMIANIMKDDGMLLLSLMLATVKDDGFGILLLCDGSLRAKVHALSG